MRPPLFSPNAFENGPPNARQVAFKDDGPATSSRWRHSHEMPLQLERSPPLFVFLALFAVQPVPVLQPQGSQGTKRTLRFHGGRRLGCTDAVCEGSLPAVAARRESAAVLSERLRERTSHRPPGGLRGRWPRDFIQMAALPSLCVPCALCGSTRPPLSTAKIAGNAGNFVERLGCTDAV